MTQQSHYWAYTLRKPLNYQKCTDTFILIEVSGDEGIKKRFKTYLTTPGTHNLGEDNFEILVVKKSKYK